MPDEFGNEDTQDKLDELQKSDDPTIMVGKTWHINWDDWIEKLFGGDKDGMERQD